MGWGKLVSGINIPDGTTKRLKIEFTGNYIRVRTDGTPVYSGTISQIPTSPGKIGYRSWYYSHNHFDNTLLTIKMPTN